MPQTENDAAARRRRRLLALFGLLLLIPAVYVGIQVHLAVRNVYRTETAITYTLADSITLPGVAVFNATAVPGGGNLGYLVADGERVTGGTALAECYATPEQGRQRERLDRVQDAIALLESSQTASGTELDQLNTQSQQAVYALLDTLDSGDYTNASANGDAFVLAQNRLQLRTGQSAGFGDLLAALQAEAEGLQAQLGALPTIQADTNGYFVSAATAAGLQLKEEDMDAMPAAELEALLSAGAPGGQSQVGYIMNGFSWRFYALCTAEQAERLKDVKTVQLSVPGKQNEPLPANILSLEQDEEGGPAKLVLECESINADVLRLGQEDARIDLHTYTGIRIDRAAMHIVDGERGVYVKYGGFTRFRRISILYENDDYILVPAENSADDGNEVRLYDEIIVEGNNLQDKKLL